MINSKSDRDRLRQQSAAKRRAREDARRDMQQDPEVRLSNLLPTAERAPVKTGVRDIDLRNGSR